MKRLHDKIDAIIDTLQAAGPFRVQASKIRWRPDETELTLKIETLSVREFDALANIVEEKFSGMTEVHIEQ